MKKLLLTGASGFLGKYILRHPQSDWKIIGTYHENQPTGRGEFHQINLTQKSRVETLFERVRPDAVIHTAAISKAGLCEAQPKLTQDINVSVPHRIAVQCTKTNIPFLFTSSDLVFDGKNAPYQETDLPNPLS